MGDIILLFLLFSPFFALMGSNNEVTTEPVKGKSMLWEVSGKGLEKSSYLFGTYHLVKGSHLGNVRQAEALFNAADGVVVEIVPDSAELLSVWMKNEMTGYKIKDLLSESENSPL